MWSMSTPKWSEVALLLSLLGRSDSGSASSCQFRVVIHSARPLHGVGFVSNLLGWESDSLELDLVKITVDILSSQIMPQLNLL
jgi:hypothetical protein